MTPRLSGHFSIFGLAFPVLNPLLGIARQWSREKFAVLTLKPRNHVRILIYRTWAIPMKFSATKWHVDDFVGHGQLKLLYPVQSWRCQTIHWTNQRSQRIPVAGKKRGKTWECDWVFHNHVPSTVVKSRYFNIWLYLSAFKTLLIFSLWTISSFSHINEDKRKTEGQVQMFEILRDVDGCPVSIFGQKLVVSMPT